MQTLTLEEFEKRLAELVSAHGEKLAALENKLQSKIVVLETRNEDLEKQLKKKTGFDTSGMEEKILVLVDGQGRLQDALTLLASSQEELTGAVSTMIKSVVQVAEMTAGARLRAIQPVPEKPPEEAPLQPELALKPPAPEAPPKVEPKTEVLPANVSPLAGAPGWTVTGPAGAPSSSRRAVPPRSALPSGWTVNQ